MIQVGIQLYQNNLKAAALANGILPVGKLCCQNKHNYKFCLWLENLKWDSTEKIIAFIDEFEFVQFKQYHKNIFSDQYWFYKIFLVQHRKFMELISLFCMYNAFTLNPVKHVNKPFLLACCNKMIPEEYFYLWTPDCDFPY